MRKQNGLFTIENQFSGRFNIWGHNTQNKLEAQLLELLEIQAQRIPSG